MNSKFSSPREEALDIALQTRKDILSGKADPVSSLRACLVIAINLNKKEKEEWIKLELNGYGTRDVPHYRIIECPILNERNNDTGKFELVPIHLSVHILSTLQNEKTSFYFFNTNKANNRLPTFSTQNLLSIIIDKCFYFLNEIISELQYGGIVEYLMEEIRKNTDEKLITINSAMGSEIQSLFNNLTSTNPADWNKVGHSCRKMLKLVADKIRSPSDEIYEMKDGSKIEVKEQHTINRLCAFIDQKTSKDERKFILVEIKYLEDYLRAITELDQKGEHKESIEKYQANMMTIHTYLILSEILKHYET